MKQKKLIDSDEIEEKHEPAPEAPDLSPHYIEDVYQDYRAFNSSIDHSNDEESRHLLVLSETIYEVYSTSRWSALGPNKKIPKDLIPFIFQEMFESLETTDFTMVEKFVSICDFMNVNYTKAYELIHMKYKELIVTEMDKKFGIISRKKIKKIF